MKKNIFKTFILMCAVVAATGCGNDFLETKYYAGIDVETGLSNVDNIGTALNGTYYRLFQYPFAGDYATMIGDVCSDISYWNQSSSHFNSIYQFTYLDTDTYLYYIWDYGYKVVDNAARIIQGAEAIYDDCTPSEQAELDQYVAEAYALRGYANLVMVNVFAHQVKVNGTDYSSELGLVLVDEPVIAYSEVHRSTVGETYDFIISDFENAISHFNAAGGDRGSLIYIGQAAVYGFLARTYLYLENWSSAASYAQQALDKAGISTLTYGDSAYKALWASGTSNTESLFALGIDSQNNWSANSCGTLWSTYGWCPSQKLLDLYGENDCRTSILDYADNSTDSQPFFNAGKFRHDSSGNSAYGTNYIVNAPEMFLIIAEANLKQSNTSAAQTALLTVAKRNADITSTSDLPSSSSDLYSFLKDERARELFQEGFRLYDLRRWDELAEVYCYGAPQYNYTYTNYQISKLVFPIPSDEITAGYGVEQNEDWDKTKP